MRVRTGVAFALLLLVAIVVAVAYLGAQPGLHPPTGEVDVAAAPGIPQLTSEAVIDYVHDGDTLFLEDGRKVRLLGIDTPEIGENAECYGDEATALLRSLLPEGTTVRVLADIEPLDQYGRSLLFIYLDDATLVNLVMLEQGAAEAVVLEPNVLYAAELEATEDRAQAARLGLWGTCG